MKPGQSITAETYCNQLDNIKKNVAEKQPRLKLKILELDLETIDHPPYSLVQIHP